MERGKKKKEIWALIRLQIDVSLLDLNLGFLIKSTIDRDTSEVDLELQSMNQN